MSVPSDSYQIAQAWTLAVEWQFYILWPLVLLRAKNPAKWLFIVIAAEPVIRLLTQFSPWRGRIGMMLHTQADPLLWGCLLGLYWNTPALERLAARVCRPLYLAACVCFLVVVSPILGIYGRGAYSLLVEVPLSGPLLAMLLFWFMRYPQTAAARVLSHPVLSGLGLISYSLYLWQPLILQNLHGASALEIAARVIALLVIATASYHLLEQMRPGMKSGVATKTLPQAA